MELSSADIKHVMQVFFIYTVKMIIPLVQVLLTHTQKESYGALFDIIRDKCFFLDTTFDYVEVIVDCKLGIHSGLQEYFLEIKIIRCRFHTTQSLYQNLKIK